MKFKVNVGGGRRRVLDTKQAVWSTATADDSFLYAWQVGDSPLYGLVRSGATTLKLLPPRDAARWLLGEKNK